MRSRDTTTAAQAVQLEAYRSLSPVERLESAISMSDEVMALSLAGIRARQPALSHCEAIDALHRLLGHPLPPR